MVSNSFAARHLSGRTVARDRTGVKVKLALAAAALLLAALAMWRPAPHPALVAAGPSSPPWAAPRHTGRPRSRPAGTGAELVVYVAGAVRRPGLYRVVSGARAADAVALAGGLDPGADAAGVNLAARLSDGDEIYAPPAGSASPPRRGRGRGAGPPARHSARRSASAALPPAEPVDVNAAGASELSRVPGIGEAIAVRIVAMRESAGSFASLDELLDVAGMSQSRLDRARPFLRPP